MQGRWRGRVLAEHVSLDEASGLVVQTLTRPFEDPTTVEAPRTRTKEA